MSGSSKVAAITTTRISTTAEIARVSCGYAVQDHSSITDVSTNRKPVCNFLLVNNTN